MGYPADPCRMAIMSKDEQQPGDRRPEARKPRGFPDKAAAVIATELRRDGDLEANDQVVVYFDTFADLQAADAGQRAEG